MKILFLGNSHTFVHYVPARFQRFCADHGEAVDVTMLTHPGVGLDWHLKQSQTYFNLLCGGYDAVVLRQRLSAGGRGETGRPDPQGHQGLPLHDLE